MPIAAAEAFSAAARSIRASDYDSRHRTEHAQRQNDCDDANVRTNHLLVVLGHRRAIYVGVSDRHMTCNVVGRSVIEPSSAKMC